MSQEIIYTSAPKGLRSGAFGFCNDCVGRPVWPRDMFNTIVLQRNDRKQLSAIERKSSNSSSSRRVGVKYQKPLHDKRSDLVVSVDGLVADRFVDCLSCLR